MSSNTIAINVLAILCLIFSLSLNRQKTKKALKTALYTFMQLIPQMLLIILLVSLLKEFISPDAISNWLGSHSGVLGILSAALTGTETYIPSIIAFPLAASLLRQGAIVTTITTFITTLTMIGLITLPLKIKELGKPIALLRNSLGFLFAILIGFMMGWIL